MATSNAEDRLLKRRINELEQEIKKLKRGMGRLKKRARKAGETEEELIEILDDVKADEFDAAEEIRKKKEKRTAKQREADGIPQCRKCQSENTKKIGAGSRSVIVCEDCGGRFTITECM